MAVTFPFLTAYDPPGASEGTLDPLGLYQIADQLAMQLVPAVRERMQRIRFLTAMAVGAIITENIEDNPQFRDASPYLVWEWLVVEAIIRSYGDDPTIWGVPGTLVTRRAIDQHGYLDDRSYLKTPRIFGFNGVYKRLAVRLGIVDIHLGIGPNSEALADAWARTQGYKNIEDVKPLMSRWSAAVCKCLAEKPPRTKPGWGNDQWEELAGAFAPAECKGAERRYLKSLLLTDDDRRLGAFPDIWQLQETISDDRYREETLHDLLEKHEPKYNQLLQAIRAYESFARRMQDGFDLIRKSAATMDIQGLTITDMSKNDEFRQSAKCLHDRYATAYRRLAEVGVSKSSIQGLFVERFGAFAEPLRPADYALLLCSHHEDVQRKKSAEGKRAWFDRIDKERIFLRHQYRKIQKPAVHDSYVHEYRGLPIRRFFKDLT